MLFALDSTHPIDGNPKQSTLGGQSASHVVPETLFENLRYMDERPSERTRSNSELAPSVSNSETHMKRLDVTDILLARPAFRSIPRPTFVALQEWEGTVSNVGTNEFSARLIDLTDQIRAAEEEVQFPIADVSDDDNSLVVPGAVFRWTIGFQRLPGGTKQRISQLVFRRLPQWTKSDISRADALALHWAQSFDGAP